MYNLVAQIKYSIDRCEDKLIDTFQNSLGKKGNQRKLERKDKKSEV